MGIRISLILALLGGTMVAPLMAHGGAYRGPGSPSGPSGPFTGGATAFGGRAPAPRTGSMPIATSGATGWQIWWEHNKDPYLRLKEAVQTPEILTRSDAFYLGAGKQDATTLAPSEEEKRDIILPALAGLLASTDNMDIATACMVAMAKIGVDHPDVKILQIFREHLPNGNQEIRETAALCLGISQRPEALDDLIALALDQGSGRKLLRRSKVDDRSRAFAIYGLGLLAWSLEDSAAKQRIQESLLSLLGDKRVDDRDIQVALIQSLGLLHFDTEVSLQKRLLWQTADLLWDYY